MEAKMSIIGLTNMGALYPEIGHLRKGAPRPQNGNKPGEDLKHFRFDTDDAEAAKMFEEAYGKEPRVVRVFLPFQTKEENFAAWREEWTASSLKHRCDGEVMVRWLTHRGTYSDEPKPCPYADKSKSEKGCKATARLKVIVRDLIRLACVVVHTTSSNDIRQIDGNLDALILMHGGLTGIPILLKRSKRMISAPAPDGKRVRREKWLISLEAERQWVELQLAAQERAARPSAEPLALPEWDGEDEDEDEVVESETAGAADSEVLKAINKLWPEYGRKIDGKAVTFAEHLRRNRGIADPHHLTQEDAAIMLRWLQTKALAVEGEPEDVRQAEAVEEREAISV